MVPMALDFLPGEADQSFEVAQVSLLEQLVAEHRAEGRGERHREFECHAVVRQPAHHAQERQIGLGDGFEEPIFLEKILVFRVPNERQMGVEDEGEGPGGHDQFLVIPSAVEGSRCSTLRFRHGILRLRFAPLRMTMTRATASGRNPGTDRGLF